MLHPFLKKIFSAWSIFFLVILILLKGSFGYCEKTLSPEVELLDFANGLFQRDFYEMALGEYKKFISLHAESQYLDEASFGMAESLFFLKSYNEAIGGYKDYIDLYPEGEKLDIAKLRLGQSLFFSKKFPEALAELMAVDINKMDNDFLQILYFYTGKAYLNHNHPEESYSFFEKTTELSADNDNTLLAFVEMGELSSGEKDYQKAIVNFQKAHDIAKGRSKKAITLYKQGEIYFLMKEYGKAIEIFNEVLMDYPNENILNDTLSNLFFSYYNSSKYQDVIDEYQRHQAFIENNMKGELFNLYYVLCRSYFFVDQLDDSLFIVEKILEIDSLGEEEILRALEKKIEILVKLNKFKDALELINVKFANLNQSPDHLLFLKAESLYNLNDFKQAHDTYQQVIQQSPSSVFADEALYSMAHSQRKLSNFSEAVNLFLKYSHEGRDEGRRQESLYNLILIEDDLGQAAEVIEHSELFNLRYKDSPRMEKVLFLLGKRYFDKKKYEKSIEAFKALISQFSDSDQGDESRFLTAYNFQMLEDFDNALKYYEIFLEKGEENKFSYPSIKNSALIYLKTENTSDASVMFDKIISRFKKNDLKIETYLWLAEENFSKKKYEDAIKVLNFAEERIEADNPDTLSHVFYLRAEALRHLKKMNLSIEDYDKVIAQGSEGRYLAASRIGKGMALVEQGQHTQAREEFQTAILENAEDNTITMRARFQLGNMALKLKDYDQAVKFFMFVSVLYQDVKYSPEALYKAGQSFEFLGKRQKAYKAYQEIFEKYPKSEFSSKAKKRMMSLDES